MKKNPGRPPSFMTLNYECITGNETHTVDQCGKQKHRLFSQNHFDGVMMYFSHLHGISTADNDQWKNHVLVNQRTRVFLARPNNHTNRNPS